LTARQFHDRTTHTPWSVRTSTHALDWDLKPFPFKVYPDLPALALPRDIPALGLDTLAALAGPAPAAATLTLEALAALLYYAAGVTRKKTYPGGGEVLFRAAPSTGALYQTEVYVAAALVDGLAPGLYHFCPGDFALRRLREGDVRGPLAHAAADPAPAAGAATVILTAIYWRNTWKYQARGYRHLFWDAGTMLANLTAVADALGVAPRLLLGFADGAVNHLLGVDPAREAALALVALGPRGAPGPAVATLPAVAHPYMPLSPSEVDYPPLREIHAASSLSSPDDVRRWRERAAGVVRLRSRGAAGDAERAAGGPTPAGSVVALPPPRATSARGLGETIQRRGSTRQFGREPISALDLSTALWAAGGAVEADVPAALVACYLTVHAVEGVAPGAYVHHRPGHALERLVAGDVRARAAYCCLEQALGGDGAATLFFLSPLDRVCGHLGDRGYRAVNLEAGWRGGRAYLAAYAQGFGASGLTFYDREVVALFSPHAAGHDAIFVTALGRAARGARDTVGGMSITPRRPSS
jgi:SagB-type dehydrogenase family enzyme